MGYSFSGLGWSTKTQFQWQDSKHEQTNKHLEIKKTVTWREGHHNKKSDSSANPIPFLDGTYTKQSTLRNWYSTFQV